MKLREIAVAGIWLASVVEVAGFTYEAFSQTYQQFAIPSGGDSASGGRVLKTPEAKKAADIGQKHSFGPLAPAVSWLETIANAPLKLLGLNALVIDPGAAGITNKELAHLNNLKQPPPTIVKQIKSAAASRDGAKMAQAANGFLAWARQNGWKQADVTLGLKAYGITVF